jgi:hypothetical protein
MNQPLRTAALAGAFSLAFAVGCQNDKNADTSASADHHPKPTGKVVEEQSAVLPVDVKAGVQRQYPGSSVQAVKKRTYDDNVTRYEVHLTTSDGRQVVQVYDAAGKPYNPTR